MKQSELNGKEGAGYTRPDSFQARPPKQLSFRYNEAKAQSVLLMEAASSDQT